MSDIMWIMGISVCPGPHLDWGRGWHCGTGLDPPVKVYFTDLSRVVLLLWVVFVSYASC